MKALARMGHLDTSILSIEKLDIKQPTFVYSKSKIQAQINEIRNAFLIFEEDIELLYAIKANNFSPIIELFKTNKFGFHISTIGEFRKLRVSNSNTYVSYTAPYISKEILDEEDIYINCNTLKEVNMVAKTNRKNIGLRVNSGYGWSLVKTADEGKGRSHFGEDYNVILNTKINGKVTRLHMHNNSDSMSISPFIKGFRNLLLIAENNRQINTINIGGGIGVKLPSSDDVFSMSDFANQLKYERELFSKHNRPIKLQIECGSYYVRNSGVYVCKIVNIVRKNDVYIYYTNGSAFHLLGNKIDRQVKPLKTSKINHKSIIVGATCSALDVISNNSKLPKLEIGDLLLVPNSGAYCAVQSNNFNMIPTPNEILI